MPSTLRSTIRGCGCSWRNGPQMRLKANWCPHLRLTCCGCPVPVQHYPAQPKLNLPGIVQPFMHLPEFLHGQRTALEQMFEVEQMCLPTGKIAGGLVFEPLMN